MATKGNSKMKANEFITEAVKQRLDPKCWKGKHKEGTKIKGGVRVNNCVPNESVEEAATAAQQSAIAIAKKKKSGVAEGSISDLLNQDPTSPKFNDHPGASQLKKAKGYTPSAGELARDLIKTSDDAFKSKYGMSKKQAEGHYSSSNLKEQGVTEGFMDTVKQAFNDCVVGYPQGTSEGQFIQGWARAIRAETGRDIPLEKLAKLYQDYTERSDEIMQSHGTLDEALDKDTRARLRNRIVSEILNFYSLNDRIPLIKEYSRTVRSKLNALDFDERSTVWRQANGQAIKLLGKQRESNMDEGEADPKPVTTGHFADKKSQPKPYPALKNTRTGKVRPHPNDPDQGVTEGSAHGYNVAKWYEKNNDQLKLTRWLRKEAGLPKDAPVYFDDADLVYGDQTIVPGALVDPKLKFNDLLTALTQATGGQGKQNVDGVYREQGVAEDSEKKDMDESAMNNVSVPAALEMLKDARAYLDQFDPEDDDDYFDAYETIAAEFNMESNDSSIDPLTDLLDMYEVNPQQAAQMLADHLQSKGVSETAAWRRKEGKSKTGGLNKKGVASYRRENPGSKLQTAVTTKPSKLKKGSKASKRRKSFCARMGGVKGPMKKPNGKPTRKALALRKWNCESVEQLQNMLMLAESWARKHEGK